MKIAAMTMCYNERHRLPTYLKYYAGQVGMENIYIVDHGSDDGSTENLGPVNIIPVPRSPFNDSNRLRKVLGYFNELQSAYDVVIYTDSDELIIADPALYTGLADAFDKLDARRMTPMGLNVTELLGVDTELDWGQPLFRQRPWVRFVSPMCKASISSEPLSRVGTHNFGDEPPAFFPGIYNFHFKRIDVRMFLGRQEVTRNMDWKPGLRENHYQRASDEQAMRYFYSFAKSKRIEDEESFDFTPYVDRLVQGVRQIGDRPVHEFGERVDSREIYKMPERFRDIV